MIQSRFENMNFIWHERNVKFWRSSASGEIWRDEIRKSFFPIVFLKFRFDSELLNIRFILFIFIGYSLCNALKLSICDREINQNCHLAGSPLLLHSTRHYLYGYIESIQLGKSRCAHKLGTSHITKRSESMHRLYLIGSTKSISISTQFWRLSLLVIWCVGRSI